MGSLFKLVNHTSINADYTFGAVKFDLFKTFSQTSNGSYYIQYNPALLQDTHLSRFYFGLVWLV